MSNTLQKSNRKTLLVLLVMSITIAIIAVYFGVGKHQEKRTADIKVNGLYLIPSKKIDDFKLFATNGKTISKDDLKGHWTMVFFGFSNCAVVCPTTMIALNKTYQLLQKELPEDQLPQIMMITVDPERDTVKRMKDYVGSFNPQFIGATGETSQLTALQKQLHILAVKVQGKGGGKNNYYYDHTAEVLVFNPSGDVQAYLSYPHKPEEMVKDYKLILSSASQG